MGQFGGRPRRHNKQNTRNMKGLAVVLVLGIGITQAQLKFGGDSSSSSSNSGSSSSSSSSSGSQSSTDTRFISTGNELVDGGILGVGAGILGGAVLSGALGNNGNNFNGNYNSPCGRRRRQAEGDGTNTRLFGLFGGNNGCNCGRRKRRQAPGEDEVGVRFFGLENLLGGGGGSNCGCNCGYNSGYNQGSNSGYNQGYNQGSNSGYNSGYNQYPQNTNSYPSSFQQQERCQCNNALTFQDKYGRTHGACITADNTGRKWCYTNGNIYYPGCSDNRVSKRFPNNPWSYEACSSSSSFSGTRTSGSSPTTINFGT